MKPTRALPWLACATLLGATEGCSRSTTEAPGVIDRETFIATYVDLRLTAVRGETGVIDDAGREAVLGRHGVTEQDLLDFADAHGRDAEMMRDVWNEIERRLNAEPADSAVTER